MFDFLIWFFVTIILGLSLYGVYIRYLFGSEEDDYRNYKTRKGVSDKTPTIFQSFFRDGERVFGVCMGVFVFGVVTIVLIC
jgi:uncharacterized membrane protein SpoIIM required for sporulation